MTDTEAMLEFIIGQIKVFDPDNKTALVPVYYGKPKQKVEGNRIICQFLGDPAVSQNTRGREADCEISISISIYSPSRASMSKIASKIMCRMDGIRGRRGGVTESEEPDTYLWSRIMTYRFACRNNTII